MAVNHESKKRRAYNFSINQNLNEGKKALLLVWSLFLSAFIDKGVVRHGRPPSFLLFSKGEKFGYIAALPGIYSIRGYSQYRGAGLGHHSWTSGPGSCDKLVGAHISHSEGFTVVHGDHADILVVRSKHQQNDVRRVDLFFTLQNTDIFDNTHMNWDGYV